MSKDDVTAVAETALLSSILIDNAKAYILEDCKPSYFLYAEHQAIALAMLKLRAADSPIDIVTLSSLGQNYEYLGHLLDNAGIASNAEHYAHLVKRCWIVRDMLEAINSYRTSLRNGDEISDILTEVKRRCLDYERVTGDTDLVTEQLSFFLALEEILKRDPNAASSILGKVVSGLSTLDELTEGFNPGQFIIIAARPGIGKSALALNIAQHSYKLGQRVMFCSMEMLHSEMSERMLSARSFIDISRLKINHLEDHEREKLLTLRDEISGYSDGILYVDKTGLTVEDLQSRVRKQHEAQGIDLLIVDHIGLLKCAKNFSSRQETVAHISQGLKELALELEIPVLALCQLNREVTFRKDHKPQLSDLRESGSLEQDADKVIMINRAYEESYTELMVVKNRQGRVGVAESYFLGEFQTFCEETEVEAWTNFPELFDVNTMVSPEIRRLEDEDIL